MPGTFSRSTMPRAVRIDIDDVNPHGTGIFTFAAHGAEPGQVWNRSVPGPGPAGPCGRFCGDQIRLMPVSGHPAEQVPQARHMSVMLPTGRNGAFCPISDGVLSVMVFMILLVKP